MVIDAINGGFVLLLTFALNVGDVKGDVSPFDEPTDFSDSGWLP